MAPPPESKQPRLNKADIINAYKESPEYMDKLTEEYFNGFEALCCRVKRNYPEINIDMFEPDDDVARGFEALEEEHEDAGSQEASKIIAGIVEEIATQEGPGSTTQDTSVKEGGKQA